MNKITKSLLIGGIITSVVCTTGIIYIIASNRIMADKKEQSRLETMVTNLKCQLEDKEEIEKVDPVKVKKEEPINEVPPKKEAMAFEQRLYSLDDKTYDSIESEYSNVDALLNDIWGALKGMLSPGAMNEVLVSQREWIKSKDTADIYTKVSMTKDRCQYLLSTYLKN
jgi:uncharacterized protein (DUF1015 family)